MNQTPLQQLIAILESHRQKAEEMKANMASMQQTAFTSGAMAAAYQISIDEAKRLLPVEEQMVIDAVNETDQKCVKIANNAIFFIKAKIGATLFEHEPDTGKKYFDLKFPKTDTNEPTA